MLYLMLLEGGLMYFTRGEFIFKCEIILALEDKIEVLFIRAVTGIVYIEMIS